MRESITPGSACVAVALYLVFAVACAAAWVNSILWCVGTKSWVLLAIDALAVPVGVVHGAWLWFH